MQKTTLKLREERFWESMLNVRVANQNCQALLSKIPKKCLKHAKKKLYDKSASVVGIAHNVTARVYLSANVGGHGFEQNAHVLDGHH